VGLYGAYEGEEAAAPHLGTTTRQLRASHQLLPALPPSLFGARARCRCCRRREQVVAKYGAVHGQRVKGEPAWGVVCSSKRCAAGCAACWLARAALPCVGP
jgi:hypothetical protein